MILAAIFALFHASAVVPATLSLSERPQDPPTAAVRTIQVTDEYALEFAGPEGWLVNENAQGMEFVSSLPSFASYINLDWYQPPRDRTYHNFDRRVTEETRYLRRVGRHVRVRRFEMDEFDAAEFSYTARGRMTVETYLALPLDDEDTWGEIYVILFNGPATAEGRRHLRAYRAMLKSMHVR